MNNIFIFGGTTEGRKLALACEALKIPAYVSVASEYGSDVLGKTEFVKVLEGRLDTDSMKELFKDRKIRKVYDATHPFATVVKDNIKSACADIGIDYIRVLRDITDIDTADYKLVGNVEEAVDYLKNLEGKILVATGSKEIAKYASINKDRIYARVLPSVESINACKDMGLESSHIIAMQGPFSEELNLALMKQYNCKYMVSKQTGYNGGFDEKIEACKKADVYPVIVGLPKDDKGISEDEAIEQIAALYGIDSSMLLSPGINKREEVSSPILRKISIVGIGPGSIDFVNTKVRQCIKEADIIVAGSGRMLELSLEIRGEADKDRSFSYFQSYKTIDIIDYITEQFDMLADNRSEIKAVVLMSGDTGFYSGTPSLYRHLEAFEKREGHKLNGIKLEIVPSISSISYLASRSGIAWHDMKIVSLHGRVAQLAYEVRHNKKVFVISSGGLETANIIKNLMEEGFADCQIHIGENMSYPEERISFGKVKDFINHDFLELCSMIIINEDAKPRQIKLGFSDDDFIRDKVPMTKSEIRALSVIKLELSEYDICYDVGAGTGSVSIEMAAAVPRGKVYAIEKKSLAVELIHKNVEKFRLDNVEIIQGEASVSMEELEAPDAVFIGGTTGKLNDILRIVFDKNPKCRVVITAISLESIAEINEACKYYEGMGYTYDIVSVAVSNTKRVAGYTMFDAKNPVLIATIKRLQ